MKRNYSSIEESDQQQQVNMRVRNSLSHDSRFDWTSISVPEHASSTASSRGIKRYHSSSDTTIDSVMMTITEEDWQCAGVALVPTSANPDYHTSHQCIPQGHELAEQNVVDTLMTMMNPECLRYFEVEYMKYAGSSPSTNTVPFQDFVAVSLDRIAKFALSSKTEESNTTGTSSSSSLAMSGEDAPPSPDSTFDFSIQNWQRKVEARPVVVGSSSCEVTTTAANFYETKSDHQLMLMEGYDDGSCHHQQVMEEQESMSSMWSDSDDELQTNYFVDESSFADCGEVEEYPPLEDNENLRQFIYCC
jgi:hypothetical protein